MSTEMDVNNLKDYELIEYPGIVKNLDKMIINLGGITKISQALGGESKRLELKYHPENVFSKPVYGDVKPRSGLLVSVKVRRSTKNPSKPPQYIVKILGYINKSFTFESLCDYQYSPIAADPTSSTGELKIYSKEIVPTSVVDFEYFDRKDIPFLSLPNAFHRCDTVHSGVLRGELLNEDGQHGTLGVMSKGYYESRDMVVFNMNDSFPTTADPQILKKMKVKYVSDEQLQKVKKLFDECPIWTRIALLYESGISNDKLKTIIPSLAFYFTTGPWRTLFVRYGYDPRKDFKSRYYQIFDFRLRFRSGVSDLVSDRKTTIRRRQENPYEINSLVQDINYPYIDETKLPRSRQCMMRYCDIRMSKIQDMLEKIPSPMAGATCNERTGWLPAAFDVVVRQIISNVIKDLLRSHYRKEQIHAEVESYENDASDKEQDDADVDDDDDDGVVEDDEENEHTEEDFPDDDDDMEADESLINDESLEEILDNLQSD